MSNSREDNATFTAELLCKLCSFPLVTISGRVHSRSDSNPRKEARLSRCSGLNNSTSCMRHPHGELPCSIGRQILISTSLSVKTTRAFGQQRRNECPSPRCFCCPWKCRARIGALTRGLAMYVSCHRCEKIGYLSDDPQRVTRARTGRVASLSLVMLPLSGGRKSSGGRNCVVNLPLTIRSAPAHRPSEGCISRISSSRHFGRQSKHRSPCRHIPQFSG
jgi:hypothetical protein